MKALFRAVIALVLLAMFLLVYSSGLNAPVAGTGEALFVATNRGILKLSPSDGATLLTIPDQEGALSLSVDSERCRFWAYAPDVLNAYDFSGASLVAVPAEHAGSAAASAVHLPDGALWLGVQKELYRYDTQGAMVQSWSYPDEVVAVVSDKEAGRILAGTKKAVLVLDASSGETLSSTEVPSGPSLTHLALSQNPSTVWMGQTNRVRLCSADGQVFIDLHFPGLRQMAPDGAGGLFIAAQRTLYRVDAAGQILLQVALPGNNDIQGLVPEAAGGGVWLATQKSVIKVGPAGQILSQWDLSSQTVITAFAAYVDKAAPALEIIDPAEGAYLNTPVPLFTVHYSDVCSGVDGGTLAFELDGAPLGATCQPGEAQAMCTPDAPLSEGLHALTTSVVDGAGNGAEAGPVHFTVDTILPTITVQSPQPGAITNDPNLGLSGYLSEPGTLTLNGQSVPVNEQNDFSTALALQEGSQALSLAAADRAGCPLPRNSDHVNSEIL